jgi:hypothetical protein
MAEPCERTLTNRRRNANESLVEKSNRLRESYVTPGTASIRKTSPARLIFFHGEHPIPGP